MKIHEYQAVELLKRSGIPVVSGAVAEDLAGAVRIAEETGYPVVLKSQVLVGGRGKAGGIKKVSDRRGLEKAFGDLKALTIKDCRVEKILIVRGLDIRKEFYVAITVDNLKNDVVLIASSAGGVDIEETAKTNPRAIVKYYFRGQRSLAPERWQGFIASVFEGPRDQDMATAVCRGLAEVFFQNDCSLAEINPLVIDGGGRMCAADAKINFDDNALFRHEEFLQMRDDRGEDADELKAKQYGLSFVKLDGNVGCIVNGAGLAMATMDVIKLLGGRPANFLDVGGSSNPEKVLEALRIILSNKDVKAVLINIFGGITRCDDIAAGILAARQQLKIDVPVVVRLIGTNEKEAKELLARSQIDTYPTMREAVVEAVRLASR